MIVPAIAVIVLDLAARAVTNLTGSTVDFNSSKLRVLAADGCSDPWLDFARIYTSQGSAWSNEEIFVLLVDSGHIPGLCLSLLIFHQSDRSRVMSAISAGPPRHIDSTPASQHYQIAAVWKFVEGLEYFVDACGRACGVALATGPSAWRDLGVQALFRRRDHERAATSLLETNASLSLLPEAVLTTASTQEFHEAHNTAEGGHRSTKDTSTSRDRRERGEGVAQDRDGRGTDDAWEGEATLLRRLTMASPRRTVPHVLTVFARPVAHSSSSSSSSLSTARQAV